MKKVPAIALFALVATSAVNGQTNATPRELAPDKSELESSIPNPAPRPKLKLSRDENLELFVLKAVKVKSDDQHFVFDNEKGSMIDKPFTWKEGGIILRNVGESVTSEIKFQYDPENNVVRLFSLSF